MKYLINENEISQMKFLKASTAAQKLHCRTTISAECLPMTASALQHDIMITKSAESLKLFLHVEVAGSC